MRKTILGVIAVLGALGAQTTRTAPAVVISGTDIQTTLRKGVANKIPDQAIRTVTVGNLNIGLGVVQRSAGDRQTPFAHDELTEIYHILSGSGTMVTGGSLVKPERLPADNTIVKDLVGPSSQGNSIENGVSRKVKVGDVIIIPPGTPHTFSQIDQAIEYEVIRVDPGKLLPLK